MSSFTFIHAADLHLDSPMTGVETYPDAPVEQLRGATRRSFDNLVDLAIDEQAAFVLLAGDIFDGQWKDYNTALYFAQRMSRLHKAGIRVFAVTGNHDASSNISKNLSAPDNVHFFSSKVPEDIYLEDLALRICGQSYSRRDVREDLVANFPLADDHYFNIGLIHTALTGREGHEPYAPTSAEIMRSKGYDYWALGHVHQREIVGRDPWIVFPGIIQGRHIQEQGPKGCTVVRIKEGEVEEVIHRDLDVLRWHFCSVNLEGCDSLEFVMSEITKGLESIQEAGDGRPVAVRLELAGQTNVHNWLYDQEHLVKEECRTRAAGLGDVWLEKIHLATRPVVDPTKDMDPDSPLAGVLRSIEDLTLSRSSIDDMPELADMLSKLPPEVKTGHDSFDPSDHALMKSIQDQVRELLFSRLLHRGKKL